MKLMAGMMVVLSARLWMAAMDYGGRYVLKG